MVVVGRFLSRSDASCATWLEPPYEKNTAGLWVTMVRWYLEAIYIEAVVSWYNQKNGGLEDDFPFQGGDFQVPCYFCGGVNDTCCWLLFLFKHPNMELQQKIRQPTSQVPIFTPPWESKNQFQAKHSTTENVHGTTKKWIPWKRRCEFFQLVS